MLYFIGVVLVSVCLLLMYRISSYTHNIEKAKKIFKSGDELLLKDIILFSNDELASWIKKSLKKEKKKVKIVYFNAKSKIIENCYSQKEISKVIRDIRWFLKLDAYGRKNSAIEDSVDEKILEIWLLHGQNKKYRTIFRNEVHKLIHEGKISNSTFNEMYRRFYKFERNEI